MVKTQILTLTTRSPG